MVFFQVGRGPDESQLSPNPSASIRPHCTFLRRIHSHPYGLAISVRHVQH